MKTIIKLLIAIAIVNAVVRVGMATASYYEFKDQVQQLVLLRTGPGHRPPFGGHRSAGRRLETREDVE